MMSGSVGRVGPEPRIPFYITTTSDANEICWWYV
ncbi:MAG: hypothetical protein CM15mV131_150 [uncultured marine virus]|nr:MAG: hypothetical protein CM15mV131_150 [uncultured marine virus]